MKKFEMFESEGGVRVCIGLYGGNPIIDQCPWFETREAAEKWLRQNYGTIHVCDRQGNNAEPLNPDDEPYSLEDVPSLEFGFDGPVYVRKATVDDDVDPRVDFVAVEDGDEGRRVVGFFRFVGMDVPED